MPYPVETPYEVDAVRAAGVNYTYGEKVAVCSWNGAVYTTAFDLTVSAASSPLYVYKSVDGGVTWTGFAIGINGEDQIYTDYYWDGTSNVFHVAANSQAVPGLIQCGSFDMETDTFTRLTDITDAFPSDPCFISHYGATTFVAYLSDYPDYMPTIACSSGGAWTKLSLDVSGSIDRFIAGLSVNTANGDVHVAHIHQPLGGAPQFAHSIVRAGAVIGPDWAGGWVTGATIAPQRLMLSGGRLVLLARVDSLGYSNWVMFYAPDPEIVTLIPEGGYNAGWFSILFSQEPYAFATTRQGDLVETPTGWFVFWTSVGNSGTERKMMFGSIDDPLQPLSSSLFFDAATHGGEMFDASFRLLDDGELHGVVALVATTGQHYYGSWDNWFLNPYAAALPPVSNFNYAY